MDKPILAIFDLDYTLTKRGTWGRFVWMNVKYRPHVWLPLLAAAGWTQWRYKKGHLPRIRVKQAMMRWAMRGKTRQHLTALAETFARNDVENGFKSGALKALEAHRTAGDTIMIASAAVDIIVAPVARLLGVTHFVATDMAWDNADCLSPEFASKNCYGDEKLNRIMSLIEKTPELSTLRPAISYSDSKADMPLLNYTERGVAVDPKPKFEEILIGHKSISIQQWT